MNNPIENPGPNAEIKRAQIEREGADKELAEAVLELGELLQQGVPLEEALQQLPAARPLIDAAVHAHNPRQE